MKLSKSNRALQGVAAATCLLGTHGALVQAAEAQSSNEGGALEEIVVTATKRPESVQVVPLTVQVVSQAALQAQNLTTTEDLKRLVPGLEFRHTGTPGNDAFNIRGIETLATAYGIEQSVGVAFDGVPLARPVGGIADLVDVHSVEVLEGPQGMLFGKNASAGLINIVTNTPELGKTDTLLRASFGSLNSRQYSGTVNLPVTDDSALRVSAWKFSHDGTIHEVNTGQYMNDQNSDGARVKYRLQATDNLNLNFTAEWDAHDQNGAGYSIRSFDPTHFSSGMLGNNGAAIQAWELSHGTTPSATNRSSRGLDNPYYDKGHTDAYTAQADYAIGQGTVTTLVSYRDIRSDDSFDPFPTDNPYSQQTRNTDFVHYDQLSEEIRYASPAADRLHYVVGVFNFKLKLHEDLGFTLNAGPAVILTDANFDETLNNENYAGFGEATFDITPKLHLIAGLRRSTDKLDVSMNRTGSALAGFGGPYAASTTTSYDDLSWRTGLQYEFATDAMAYATVSRGYKGPGIGYSLDTNASTLAASNNGVVKPEIVHAYEVGIKSQWWDRRVTANVAVFHEVFDDFQTSVTSPGPFPGFNIVAITNAGQAKSTGVNLNASWLVTQYFSLTATGVYDNARYTDFRNAGCYNGPPSGFQTAAQGCINGVQNLDGKRLADVPKTSVNLTGRFEHPITEHFRGFFQANGSYRSNISFSSLEDPQLQQGGYSLLNLTAGINTSDGRWGVSVYGNNVLDHHYVDRIVTNSSGDYVFFNDISYQDLQTFGIAVTAHF